MVTGREDVVGLDSSIILPRQTWVASGHVGEFTDPLTECQSCHKRFRVDHMQEALAEKEAKKGKEVDPDSIALTDIACLANRDNLRVVLLGGRVMKDTFSC